MIKRDIFVNEFRNYIVEEEYVINHDGFQVPVHLSLFDLVGNVNLYITSKSIVDLVINPTIEKLDKLSPTGNHMVAITRKTISEIDEYVQAHTLRKNPDDGDVPTLAFYMDYNFERTYQSLLKEYIADHMETE